MSLMSGIEAGDLQEVKTAIKKNKRNMKVHSKRHNSSPLEYAITQDEVEIVDYMIMVMQDNDMTYNHNRTGGKVMMSAIRSVKMGKLLQSLGFSIEDKDGGSVISALLSQWLIDDLDDVVKFVIDNGADINKGSANNWSPLMNACSHNNLEIMQLLADNGADINYTDWNNRNILDLIEQEKTIEKFITFGPKMTDRNLDILGDKYPHLLGLHPNISDYIEKLIGLGYPEAIPADIQEMFLF